MVILSIYLYRIKSVTLVRRLLFKVIVVRRRLEFLLSAENKRKSPEGSCFRCGEEAKDLIHRVRVFWGKT